MKEINMKTKISELIEMLQEAKEKYGDIECVRYDNSSEGGIYTEDIYDCHTIDEDVVDENLKITKIKKLVIL